MASLTVESKSHMDNNTAQNLSTEIPRSALDIIDEMADRERNIVVSSFPESADCKADIVAFQALCTTVFKLDDTDICKAII